MSLKEAVKKLVENNGGPIDSYSTDGNSTVDGKDYVLVLRDDFDAVCSVLSELQSNGEL